LTTIKNNKNKSTPRKEMAGLARPGCRNDPAAQQRQRGLIMKFKASTQIIQAVLIMLAMVCGMQLLLPGNDVSGAQDCVPHDASDTAAMKRTLRQMSSARCTQAGTSGTGLD
jgi:hypothetical protein